MDAEEEFAPRKVTVVGGVLFNPWVNVTASMLITAGAAWMTAWFWRLWVSTADAPAYEDQGLDIAGTFIGMVILGMVAIALFVVTIWLIVWWAKRGWRLPEPERLSRSARRY